MYSCYTEVFQLLETFGWALLCTAVPIPGPPALDKEKMEGVEVKAGLGGSPVAGGQRAGDAEGAQSPC